MKNRPSAEKRRKELRRLEKQRDKADRRKLRKENPLGSPDEAADGSMSLGAPLGDLAESSPAEATAAAEREGAAAPSAD